jgi:hypothetical protein
VQIFNSASIYQSTIGTTGSSGSGNNQFNDPRGLAIGPTGTIYVADAVNDRVQVFNSAGVYQSTIGITGSPGGGNNQLNVPIGVAVNPNGMVYVADTGNNRVVRYFDPSSWVSGINTFTDPTVGPTSVSIGGVSPIFGNSLTLASSMGLVVGDTLSINSGGSLVLAGGTLSANAISLNAGGAFNGSVFALGSGQSLTQNGGTMAVSTLTIAGNYIYQSGSISSAMIALAAGGSFTAATASGFTLPAGTIFEANQGGTIGITLNVYVSGVMSLDGGTTLTAGSLVDVTTGGLLAVGNATVSPAELFIGTGGELRLTNSVEASVNTPSVYNYLGLIDGSGRVNGTLNNQAGAEVNADFGQNLVFTSANNKNYGLFSLTGGDAPSKRPRSNS